MIVNVEGLVPVPAGLVTLIVPVVAPAGTVAVICEGEMTVYVAVVPLIFTEVLFTKLEPVIVMLVPTVPLVGAKLILAGAFNAKLA